LAAFRTDHDDDAGPLLGALPLWALGTGCGLRAAAALLGKSRSWEGLILSQLLTLYNHAVIYLRV